MTSVQDNKVPLLEVKSHDKIKTYEIDNEPEEKDFNSENHRRLYSLPDVEHINKFVMCKLLTVSVVCLILMIIEIIGGFLAGSLAIMTDAAHLFSDLSGKGVRFFCLVNFQFFI